MNFLDWCLVLLAVAYALSGYWQGFIAGAFATAGLLLGGLAGIWLAPMLLGDAAPSLWVSLGALFVVLRDGLAGPGRCSSSSAPGSAPGSPGSRSGPSTPSAGPRSRVVAVLLVAWMLGVAISGSRIPGISPQVRDSRVLVAVNDVMPVQAQQALRSFDNVVGSGFFPRYLEPFAPRAHRRGRPGQPAGAARPRHPAGGRSGVQDPQQQPVRQRGRGHRLPLRARTS